MFKRLFEKLFGKKEFPVKTIRQNDRFTLCVEYLAGNMSHETKLMEYKYELIKSGLDFRVEQQEPSFGRKLCVSVPKEDEKKLWIIHNKVYGQ